jgi:hypothetical protein
MERDICGIRPHAYGIKAHGKPVYSRSPAYISPDVAFKRSNT